MKKIAPLFILLAALIVLPPSAWGQYLFQKDGQEYGGLVSPEKLKEMERRLVELAERQLEERGLKGELTSEEVEKRKDYLSPDKYEKYLKWANGWVPPPTRSDSETVINLTHMALDRNPKLRETADSEFKAGKLTANDYMTILTMQAQ
jgi:hypothetical protein